jgi:hypothetical protein
MLYYIMPHGFSIKSYSTRKVRTALKGRAALSVDKTKAPVIYSKLKVYSLIESLKRGV